LSLHVLSKTQAEQNGNFFTDTAVIAHSHWDHISGLEDFPGLEVRMPTAELQFIRDRKMPGLIDQMIDKLNVHTFDFTGGPYENFDRSLDLFNDGSVALVPLPGHTTGPSIDAKIS